jgi:hypothetical protein
MRLGDLAAAPDQVREMPTSASGAVCRPPEYADLLLLSDCLLGTEPT